MQIPKKLVKVLASVLPAIVLVTGCGGSDGSTSVGIGVGVGVESVGVGFQESRFEPELVWFSSSASWIERVWINRDTGAVPFSDNFFTISGAASGPVGTTLTVTEQLGSASLLCDRWTLVTEGTISPRIISCVRQLGEPESTNVLLEQAQRTAFQRNPIVGISVFFDSQEYFVDFSAVRRVQEQTFFLGNDESVPFPML